MTDGQGRTIDFRNTLIILTSNLGSEIFAEKLDTNSYLETQEKVMEVVKGSFKPEFINRLDEIILFQRLLESDMSFIVEIQLNILRGRLKDRGITLTVSNEAVTWLSHEGYDPTYGARPLKRVIQRKLENEIANLILSNQIKTEDTINVQADEDGLLINGGKI